MSMTITPFLRKTLVLDAAVSGAAGVLMVFGASLLAPLLQIPQPLLFWSGLLLFPFVAMLAVVARREAVARFVIVDIIAINALWVAASFGILVTGSVQPNILGVLFIAAQAIAVAGFAALQMAGFRSAAAVHA